MNHVYNQLVERNARESEPFLSIYESNSSLLSLTDTLQQKLVQAEQEMRHLRQQVNGSGFDAEKKSTSSALQSALRSETRLHEKLERLQEEYNSLLKKESEVQSDALQTATRLRECQALSVSSTSSIEKLKKEVADRKKLELRMEQKVADAEANTKLAEQQYDGLKSTIRSLQEENDTLKKENRVLEVRMVEDKGKMVEEMNSLTELVEKLKSEVDMLHLLKTQEESLQNKKGWFAPLMKVQNTDKSTTDAATRKFGHLGVVCPTTPKHIVKAHAMEGTCVRYDDTGLNIVATSSSDSTVKIWDTTSGIVRATLRGSPGYSIMGCDVSGSLAIGAGTDKMCRVWNIRTERMIHQLVGHQHKITCVRLFAGGRAVLTGSADRSMKVWDISRKTYRQTTTLRHSSTSTCIDVASDSITAVSGHLDQGLRFWDLRSGERTVDISGIHEAGITSVQFNPVNNAQVLTNSLDSSLKIVDVQTGTAIATLRAAAFSTSHGWSSSVYSPDGRFVAAGSSMNGAVFVWETSSGKLTSTLTGAHNDGVVGIDWCRGGSGGQQVCSIDRKGVMVLWA